MAMNCTLIVHSYWFDTCTWQLAHAQPLRSHGCLAAAAASSSRRVQVSQHCATHGYVQELYGYTRLRCSYKQERKSSSFWAALSCRHCSPVACHLWLWLVWKVVVFWSTATRSKQALYLCDSVVFFSSILLHSRAAVSCTKKKRCAKHINKQETAACDSDCFFLT